MQIDLFFVNDSTSTSQNNNKVIMFEWWINVYNKGGGEVGSGGQNNNSQGLQIPSLNSKTNNVYVCVCDEKMRVLYIPFFVCPSQEARIYLFYSSVSDISFNGVGPRQRLLVPRGLQTTTQSQGNPVATKCSAPWYYCYPCPVPMEHHAPQIRPFSSARPTD